MGRDGMGLRNSSGFTLLELVLATTLSAMVVGILSMALSFSLRVWEREQNRKHSDIPNLVDLLKWQLATFDPIYFTIEGKRSLVFHGTATSLAFTTDHSVKALSRGAPVVARYVFSRKDHKVFYGEMPIDPYKPEPLKAFLNRKPEVGERTWPPFFSTDAADFSLSYAEQDSRDKYSETWEDDSAIPAVVLLKWVPEEGDTPFENFVMPNFLFPRSTDKKGAAAEAASVQKINESGE